MPRSDDEPTILTAPGMAPEARHARADAVNRAYDALTGKTPSDTPCGDCGELHPSSFEWRGRTRLWHAQQRDSARG